MAEITTGPQKAVRPVSFAASFSVDVLLGAGRESRAVRLGS
jgi:hypothetical protein